MVSKGLAHQFWQAFHAGAAAARNGPAQETARSRSWDVMTARRVDGPDIAPVDREALVQSVEKAVDAGVAVTNSFVATNIYQAGGMAARALGAALSGQGKILEFAAYAGQCVVAGSRATVSVTEEIPGWIAALI